MHVGTHVNTHGATEIHQMFIVFVFGFDQGCEVGVPWCRGFDPAQSPLKGRNTAGIV